MNLNSMKLTDKRFWYLLAGLLLIPALLINLGLQTLNDDEAIRTIVAMEMDYSGNYIVPTWNGVEYRAKPPFYNWMLVASFKVFGVVNEWTARIPNILFLGLFGFSIYYFSRKHFSREYSALNALLFVTCGRILFWDTMLAYIDILYSMVTFTTFMVIFHAFEKKKFWNLFLLSYLLCSIGFLLKGFPTLLFQAITLLVLFVSEKRWKKLFSIEHIVGILLFVTIVGSYYFSYIQQAELDKTLSTLLDQSTRRTAIHEQYDYLQFFSHLLTYPLENIYHFLPWSLMVIYLFSRNIIKKITDNKFLKFCASTFLANVIVYWVSVEVYPRYIFMLVPLVFSIFLYLHKEHYDANSKLYKIHHGVQTTLFALLFLAAIGSIMATTEVDIPYRYVKLGISLAALLFIFYHFLKYKNLRLITFICAILMIRILFNWVFIPERHQGDVAAICKEQAINLGRTYKNDSLVIHRLANIDLTSSVYLARERDKITPRSYTIPVDGVMIFDTSRAEMPENVNIVRKICVREGSQTLFVIKKQE